MKISIFLAWYDIWIGLFWDRKEKIAYFCPFPMVVIKIRMNRRKIDPKIFPNSGRRDSYQSVDERGLKYTFNDRRQA